ncbi:hypothetical protein RB653_004228 [Dictyostelium firmibasis]|uniref:Uncharacterized protein n=1 Tax=Dictyostelium firmibasis TaxID=79012 RepID=A0AAN7U9E2_9MYCE
MRNVKGGVWKNTEDEILKVAIMKYGLNQWARISSLLTRKSPAQCKARWHEWLDPTIKKTEWSKEEEEKLLHLAKIFPSQWKTIAPLVGRTASQCLERYNRLLDEVQRQQDNENGGTTTTTTTTTTTGGENDPRRLRMGDIDPTPETKPAKPDPIDMDEDEKETLSEAKARLSNTQGKKEKRKFREKQLEEARRLAFLQKKRELKAAGINYNPKKKGKEKSWDISKEIPFFLKPKAGFYDVPEEELRDEPNKDALFIGKRVDQIENPNYLQRQEKLNKLEEIKKSKKEMLNLPQLISETSKSNDVEHSIKRTKLQLPEPQLTDDDIQEIADYEKLNGSGVGGEFPLPAPRTASVSSTANNNNNNTNNIRTPMKQDTIMSEAQNLLALSNAQTPLKGGVGPNVSQTPLPKGVNSTPFRTPNPLANQTPQHNKKQSLSESNEFAIEDKFKRQQGKNQLLSSLKNLPSPTIEYKLELPTETPTIEEESQLELDNSEVHIREQQQLKHKEQFKLRNRSTVLKRNLPRSRNLFPINSSSSNDDELRILKEINRIISHDNKTFPNDSITPSMFDDDIDSQNSNTINDDDHDRYENYDYFTNTELEFADKLIQEEIEQIKKETQQPLPSGDEILDEIDQIRSQFIYLPKENRFIEKSNANQSQLIQNLQFEYDKTLNKIKNSSMKSVNLEKKLNIYNGGYQNRSNAIIKNIGDMFDQLEQSEIEYQCFVALKNNESIQMEKRLKSIENQVYDQCEIESRLQQKYAQLLNEKNLLKKKLSTF